MLEKQYCIMQKLFWLFPKKSNYHPLYKFHCLYLTIIIFRFLEATICYLKAENWEEAHNLLTNHLFAKFIFQKGKLFEQINSFSFSYLYFSYYR